MYSAIAYAIECLYILWSGSQQVSRDCIPGVKLKMTEITVSDFEGIEDSHKHTPLTYAAAFGQTGILEYLVQQKADLNFHSYYPVFCQYGEEKCAKVIMISFKDCFF